MDVYEVCVKSREGSEKHYYSFCDLEEAREFYYAEKRAIARFKQNSLVVSKPLKIQQ